MKKSSRRFFFFFVKWSCLGLILHDAYQQTVKNEFIDDEIKSRCLRCNISYGQKNQRQNENLSILKCKEWPPMTGLESVGVCRHNFKHNTISGASGIMQT